MIIKPKSVDLNFFIQAADEFEKILSESSIKLLSLDKFNVPLYPDPVAVGLSSINAKISQIQMNKDELCQVAFEVIDLKNDCENLSTEVNKWVAEKKSEITVAHANVLDSMKTQAMREAAIVGYMREECEILSRISQLENRCKNNYDKVKKSLDNLESCNQNLKKQIEVVGFQIQINEISRKGE
jgi:hypothetical protein